MYRTRFVLLFVVLLFFFYLLLVIQFVSLGCLFWTGILPLDKVYPHLGLRLRRELPWPDWIHMFQYAVLHSYPRGVSFSVWLSGLRLVGPLAFRMLS